MVGVGHQQHDLLTQSVFEQQLWAAKGCQISILGQADCLQIYCWHQSPLPKLICLDQSITNLFSSYGYSSEIDPGKELNSFRGLTSLPGWSVARFNNSSAPSTPAWARTSSQTATPGQHRCLLSCPHQWKEGAMMAPWIQNKFIMISAKATDTKRIHNDKTINLLSFSAFRWLAASFITSAMQIASTKDFFFPNKIVPILLPLHSAKLKAAISETGLGLSAFSY